MDLSGSWKGCEYGMDRWAIVTGASSGIGREISLELDRRGYCLLLVARREDRLRALQKELRQPSDALVLDIRSVEACQRLHAYSQDRNVEILVNNAGFGSISAFLDDELERDIAMIQTNIIALHTLCKLYLRDFCAKDRGWILNVASMASFAPAGPYMAVYYASKAYVGSLSAALVREMKDQGSRVYLGALHPGPVPTEFGSVARSGREAGSLPSLGSISAQRCARIAVDKMFAGKHLILPGFWMKLLYAANKLLPRRLLTAVIARIQKAKTKPS